MKTNSFIEEECMEKSRERNSISQTDNKLFPPNSQQLYLAAPSSTSKAVQLKPSTPSSRLIKQNNIYNYYTSPIQGSVLGEQLSERSEEENENQKGDNFVNIFKELKLKRKILAFLSEIPSRRFETLVKKHFKIISDISSHFKVSQQLFQLKKQSGLKQIMRESSRDQVQFQNIGHFSLRSGQSFQKEKIAYKNQFQIFPQESISKNNKIIATTNCFQLMSTFFHKLKSKIIKLINKLPLIDFESNQKFIWDGLYCASSLIFYYCIPLHVALNIPIGKIIQMPLLSVSWFILMIHIFITLNTSYFEKGKLVIERIKILQNYFVKDLLPDFSSLFPLSFLIGKELLYTTSMSQDDPFQIILSTLFLFNIFQVQKVLTAIEERFHLNNKFNHFFKLVKLLFYLLFITHVFACVWIYLGRVNYSSGKQSWMILRNIEKESWSIQYLQGFYFVTVTMISVGYGDIVPQTSSEIILCIVIMLISCGVFAYSLNMIGEILGSIYQQDNIVKEQVRIIGNFMAKNNINPHLRQQIRIYLEYYQRQFSEQNQKEEEKIIGQLSENLKNSLLIETNKFILKESPIFSKFFSQQVIENLVSIIKEYRCTPEQIIYERGLEKEDHRIFFIKSGMVEMFASPSHQKGGQEYSYKKTSVKILKPGQSFGEIQFFTGNNDFYSAKSLEFSQVLYINRRDFLEILKQHPLDYEKFCFVKDKISLLQDASCIDLKCYICFSSKHLTKNCNMTHLVLQKSMVARRQQYMIPNQERSSFNRREFKTPWQSELEDVRECAWRLQDNNESYIENASWMSWDSESYVQIEAEDNVMNLKCYDTLNFRSRNSSLTDSARNKDFDEVRKRNSDSSREQHKQHQLNIPLEQISRESHTPENIRLKKVITPSNFHRQLLMHNYSSKNDISPFNSGDNKQKNNSHLKDEAVKSLITPPMSSPCNNGFESFCLNQKKLMKMIGIGQQLPLKSQNTMLSQYSEGNNNNSNRNANFKLSAFNTNQNNLHHHDNNTPQFQQRKQNQIQNQNNQLNIAEIIENQLQINNKNNSIEENTSDIKKVFQFYFLHNNYSNVLKKYNRPIIQMIKNLQKQRAKKRKGQSLVRQNSLKLFNLAGNVPLNINSPKKSFFNQGNDNTPINQRKSAENSTFKNQLIDSNSPKNKINLSEKKKKKNSGLSSQINYEQSTIQQNYSSNIALNSILKIPSVPKQQLNSPIQELRDDTNQFKTIPTQMDSDVSLIQVGKKYSETVGFIDDCNFSNLQNNKVNFTIDEDHQEINKSNNLDQDKSGIGGSIMVGNQSSELIADPLSNQIQKFKERKRLTRLSQDISKQFQQLQQQYVKSYNLLAEENIQKNKEQDGINVPNNSVERDQRNINSLLEISFDAKVIKGDAFLSSQSSQSEKQKRHSKTNPKNNICSSSSLKKIISGSKQRFSELVQIEEQKSMEYNERKKLKNFLECDSSFQKDLIMANKRNKFRKSQQRTQKTEHFTKQAQSQTYIQSQESQKNISFEPNVGINSHSSNNLPSNFEKQIPRKTQMICTKDPQIPFNNNSFKNQKGRKSEFLNRKDNQNPFQTPSFQFEQENQVSENQKSKQNNMRRFSRAYNMALVSKRTSSKNDLPLVTKGFNIPSQNKYSSSESYSDSSMSSQSQKSELKDIFMIEKQAEERSRKQLIPPFFNFDID